MHILILTHYWPPEIGASSHLTFELGETLVELGHRVTVVTGMPSYNMKTIPERYRGQSTFEEEMNGMRVLRVETGSTHSKTWWRRGVEHLVSAPLYALRARAVKDVDVVYTISPPLTMGLAAWAVARRRGAGCCLGVQDLFPQNAIDLGMLKNPLAILALRALERFVYRVADAVTVHSEGNKEHIVATGKRAEQVHSLPNWVDTDLIRPAERMNAFRSRFQIPDSEFVVSFAGTMGWSQGLDSIIDTARLCKNEPNLSFLLIGDGTEREKLEALSQDLPNVRFLPMQAKEVYPEILAAADACLVTLRPEVFTPVIPSKLLTIMAAGRPVLASLPLAGDAPKVIREACCGLIAPAGDAATLAESILLLKRDPARAAQFGASGRSYALRHFSRPACVRQFEHVFRLVARNAPPAASFTNTTEEVPYELPTTLRK